MSFTFCPGRFVGRLLGTEPGKSLGIPLAISIRFLTPCTDLATIL